MYKLDIKDLVLSNSTNSAQLICEDENGDYYSFTLSNDRSRVVYLLLYDTYLPKQTIYEVFLKFLNALSMNIEAVVVDDTKNLSAYMLLKTSDETQMKMDIYIQDAFILGLISKVAFYVKKDACFVEHNNFCWIDFLRRFF